MANIFISYSSADKTLVQKLSQLLASKGWTVWWDRQIPIGQNFDMVIESELDACDCALVIWTAKSVASEWVRAEAAEAAKQKKLVPILLEQVEVPLAFRNMEAALLIGWDGEDAHPELDLFYNAIEQKITGKPSHRKTIVPKPEPRNLKKIIGISSLALVGILIAVGIIFWIKKPDNDHRITITGKIKTAAEQPISKAEINVEGTKHVAISATDGTYTLTLDEFLPGDEITISASHPAFEDKFFFFQPKEKNIQDFDIYLNPIAPTQP